MSTAVDVAVKKFHDLRDAVRPELIEREDEIDIIVHALLSRTHVCLIGGPGVAKSMLFDRIIRRISGVVYFHDLAFKASPPETFIGPVSIPELKNGRQVRVVDGFIPACDVANVEEVWNLSTTVLQSLYMMANERLFRNGADTAPVPLSSLFSSSNIFPQQQHDELAPLWDRIHARKVVPPPTPAGLRRVLDLELDDNPNLILSWAQVLEAQQHVRDVVFTDECKDALHAIALKLAQAGISATPRRLRQIQSISKAAAFLDGETKTDLPHLEPLVHCLWNEDGQMTTVEKVVLDVTSPASEDLLKVSDAVAGLADRLADALKLDKNDPAREGQAVELLKKLKREGKALMVQEKKIPGGRALRIVEETWRRLERLHHTNMTEIVGVSKPATLRDEIEAD